MTEKSLSASRQAGRSSCSLEQSHANACETEKRMILRAVDHVGKVVKYIRPRCKMWKCGSCAEINRIGWAKRAAFGCTELAGGGGSIQMVTLTSHENQRKLYPAILVWRDAWRKLGMRWRRKQPGQQYLYIGEHKWGMNFHVHMLTTATIEQNWYKDAARKCGLGYMADVETLHNPVAGGWYASKYLTKAMRRHKWPKYWRMVNTSRDWPKLPKDAVSDDDWKRFGTDLGDSDVDIAKWLNRDYEVVVL